MKGFVLEIVYIQGLIRRLSRPEFRNTQLDTFFCNNLFVCHKLSPIEENKERTKMTDLKIPKVRFSTIGVGCFGKIERVKNYGGSAKVGKNKKKGWGV